MYDIMIIGAGTAGLTAAIYALRAGKKIIVAEGELSGGQIIYSPRIENFPGFTEISGSEFAERLITQAKNLGAEIINEKISGIERNSDGTFTIHGDTDKLAETVIISTGTKHRHLGVEREEALLGKGISYCAICDGAFFRRKKVAVVGGGSAALQSAEYLSAICERVYLIHRRDEFRGEQSIASELSEKKNVELILNSNVTEISGDDFLESVTVENKKNSLKRNILIDGLFIMVGQEPQNEVFKGFVDIDDSGYIIADESCKTNVKGVFAAGDCRTKNIRQLTTAAADGTVAALEAIR